MIASHEQVFSASIMSIRQFENSHPQIGARVYVDPAAEVIGDVILGEDSSVWPGAVLRGDIHSIRIGARTSIQDHCVLHVTHDSPFHPGGFALEVGDNVTVGHGVLLHGCYIGHNSLIGMGCIVMDGAYLEDGLLLGAGSLVSPGKRLSSGYLWVGRPAQAVRPLSQEEKDYMQYAAKHYVKLKDRYLIGNQ